MYDVIKQFTRRQYTGGQKRKWLMGFRTLDLIAVTAIFSALCLTVGFYGGAIISSEQANRKNSIEYISRKVIAGCAVGMDKTLRRTEGVASFNVTFIDDMFGTITCVSLPGVASPSE